MNRYIRSLRSTSGKSSKLEVSSMPLTSTGITAGLSLHTNNHDDEEEDVENEKEEKKKLLKIS